MTEKARYAGAHTAGPAGEDRAAPRSRGRRLLVILLRVGLVLVVIGGVLELQGAATYRLAAGSVTFQLRPAWPGGHLVMPLGPAGELSLHTHRTPVDVVMDYRLPAETAALLGDASSPEVPRIEGGARAAFDRYLLGPRCRGCSLVGAAAGCWWRDA